VVAVAHRAELATPKRSSLPSMFPPGLMLLCWVSTPSEAMAGLPVFSAQTVPANNKTKMMVMAARMAQPWRVSPTILPKV
jgi:hypothetical protein